MCNYLISHSDAIISGVIAGLIATIIYAFFARLLKHYSPDARFARKRLKACKKAIYELIERFNISVGQSVSFEFTPTLTPENYKLCLFETYLILNNTTGNKRYPDVETYKDEANRWYNEWNNKRMASSIEFISPAEMESLLIEVNSWGVQGRPWTYTHFPKIMRAYNQIRGWIHNQRSNLKI